MHRPVVSRRGDSLGPRRTALASHVASHATTGKAGRARSACVAIRSPPKSGEGNLPGPEEGRDAVVVDDRARTGSGGADGNVNVIMPCFLRLLLDCVGKSPYSLTL